jgi:hypothetical protein
MGQVMSETVGTKKCFDLDNVQNAIEASSPGDLGHEIDNDPGLAPNESFRPSRSTKPESCGISAFLSQELIRRAGDDIAVKSEGGTAATMRVITR